MPKKYPCSTTFGIDPSKNGLSVLLKPFLIFNLWVWSEGRTHEQEYFEHLERFLGLIEPIIDDLKGKGFIK